MFPVILFALHREAAPFYRAFSECRRISGSLVPAWLCGSGLDRVLVLETGAGGGRSRAALRWLSDVYLPDQPLLQPLFVISAGFAGGLRENWHVGDVLLATETIDRRGRIHVSPQHHPLHTHARPGRVLTLPRIASKAEEKRRLGRDYDADVVDMESAAVATFCAARGIPWACVRAVSDEVGTDLSRSLLGLIAGRRSRLPRVLTTILRSPSVVLEMLRLARATRLAAASLGKYLHWLVRQNGRQSVDQCQPRTRAHGK